MLGERDYMHGGRGQRGVGGWSAVKTLLVINIAVWILCGVFGNDALLNRIVLHAGSVRDFQLWRLVTYMFTHLELGHLVCNMWSLWLFGGMVESVLGKRRVLLLYVFCGLLGGVFWVLSNWNNPQSWCIGASGSTCGIMLAAALAFPNRQMMLLFPPIPMRLRTMAIVFFFWELLCAWNGTGNIAHLAHLGGMLGGFIFISRLDSRLFGGRRGFVTWFNRTFGPSPSRPSAAENGGRASSGNVKGNRLGNLDSDEVDRILDKLSTTGRSSLTEEERAILEEASRRLRDS